MEQALRNEIKKLQKVIEDPKESEEEKKKAEIIKKGLLEDLTILGNYFEKGLIKNLKEVINQ